MPSSDSLVSQVIDFLASVKLALVILIVTAIACIAGTIIPQNLDPHQYLDAYGPKLYTFLNYLDMFDMYHSVWFNALLGALVINLVICTIKRLPVTMKLARPIKPDKVKPDFLKKQAFSNSGTMAGSLEASLPGVRDKFRQAFSKPLEKKMPWGTLLYADKGAFSRFGVYVVHCSLLFIVAGALVGSGYGFSAFLNIDEGETASQVIGRRPSGTIQLPFQIRLDDFSVEFYKTGAPSEYRSEVTVLDGGKEVEKASIRVNHPLTYRNVTFYQSSYGQRPAGDVVFSFHTEGIDPVEVKVTPGQTVPLPGGKGTVRILDLQENLMNVGPAAKLLVRPSEGKAYAEWIFQKRPDFVPAPEGPLYFDLTSFSLVYYSGLQVNKDPGVPLIWTGFVMMLLGFLGTFFLSHQKMYVGLIDNGGSTQILLAGSSHRNQGAFKLKFDGLTADILNRPVPGDE